MNALEGLLKGGVADPQNEDRWLVLADYLEEHGDPRRAELLRLHRKLLGTCFEPAKHPERAAWHARIVTLLVEGVLPCVPQRTVALGEGVEMAFSFIPPGSFLMGSPPQEDGRRDDEVLHRVTLTRGFWLGTHLVTQAQWLVLMGSSPSTFRGNDWPVEHVSWDACQEFCEKLGQKAGERWRLLTEAEWEWACRAGTTTAYHTGDGLAAMKGAGWCNHDGTWGTGKTALPGYLDYGSGAAPRPVGQFSSNAWGLFDMHGNVWEWCSDWYDRRYRPEGHRIDPFGPDEGSKRVLRGGCFFNAPPQCRSACRQRLEPDFAVRTVGCRVCLCPDEPGR